MPFYVEKKITYHHYQSWCRKNHSTLIILIKLRDDIERAMKSGEVTFAVFVDFSKAFDTINNVLIHKLHSLYFSKNLLYLILNYLSNRSHFIQKGLRCSNLLYSKFALGSILGPVLFNYASLIWRIVFPVLSASIMQTILQYIDIVKRKI